MAGFQPLSVTVPQTDALRTECSLQSTYLIVEHGYKKRAPSNKFILLLQSAYAIKTVSLNLHNSSITRFCFLLL